MTEGTAEFRLLGRFDLSRYRELLRTSRSDGMPEPVFEVWPINATTSYLNTTLGELARELFEEYGNCSTYENDRGENFAWQFVASNARVSAHRRRYEILVNKLSSKEGSNTST